MFAPVPVHENVYASQPSGLFPAAGSPSNACTPESLFVGWITTFLMSHVPHAKFKQFYPHLAIILKRKYQLKYAMNLKIFALYFLIKIVGLS